jgi:hypothetical protein
LSGRSNLSGVKIMQHICKRPALPAGLFCFL